ncbi:MAG: hypothetical protein R2695_14500 [Acidimicrobiales bacterium]
MTETTILRAAALRTLDPATSGDAVALREGHIVDVGAYAELASAHPAAVVDDRFADQVIVPGFVEAHAHSMAGGIWQHVYVGYFDNRDPQGRGVARLPIARRGARSAPRGRCCAVRPRRDAVGLGPRPHLLPR